MAGHKEALDCLKTQTAQGKMQTELKNEVFHKALLCTSRGGGILKACLLLHQSNGVEQKASSEVRSSLCEGKLLFPPFLNGNKKYLNWERKSPRWQERGENSRKVHFIKVGRDILLHLEMILRPRWEVFFWKDLLLARSPLAVK